MNVELMIQDNQSGTVYDASTLLMLATWSGQMHGQPGRLRLELVGDGSLTFYEGSPVQLKADGFNLFSGWVFSKSRGDRDTITAVCYDQLRYLKNCESYVFDEATASEIFTKICADFQLKAKVVHPSTHKLPGKLYSNKTLGGILQDSLDITRKDTGKEFFIRDNFGTLEFLDAAKLQTELIIGDGSLMTGYRYDTSIDEDTYNRVKLARENNQTAQRELYSADAATIPTWGILQYYEMVEDGLNAAQLKARGDEILKQKNRITRRLSVSALGDFRVLPGNSVWVEADLDDTSLSRHMLVRDCSHTIENNKHTMEITLEVAEE